MKTMNIAKECRFSVEGTTLEINPMKSIHTGDFTKIGVESEKNHQIALKPTPPLN